MYNFFIMGFVAIFNLLTFNFDKVNSLYILLPFDYFKNNGNVCQYTMVDYNWLQKGMN